MRFYKKMVLVLVAVWSLTLIVITAATICRDVEAKSKFYYCSAYTQGWQDGYNYRQDTERSRKSPNRE
jgi:hypothetical protein